MRPRRPAPSAAPRGQFEFDLLSALVEKYPGCREFFFNFERKPVYMTRHYSEHESRELKKNQLSYGGGKTEKEAIKLD